MIFQLILIALFTALLIRFLAKANSSQTKAWKKIIGVMFTAIAIVAVLFPETTDGMAHLLGIGRGADLLLYTVTMAFIASLISNYAKRKQDQVQFVRLARKIAILEAQNKKKVTR